MHSGRKILGIVLTLALVTGAALAEEPAEAAPKVEHVQKVQTDSGVIVAVMRADTEGAPASGFLVRATETPGKAKGEAFRAVCKLPADEAQRKQFKIFLMPVFKESGKETAKFKVVTWGTGTGKSEKKQPARFDNLKEIGKQAIDADFAVTVKPVWAKPMEETPASVKSMELMALLASKPEKPSADVKRAAKGSLEPITEAKLEGSKPIEYSRVELALPAEQPEKARYGVLLIPRWKEDGKTLQGFDAVLVEAPEKSDPKAEK